jgi:pimeloyl-ACP methyl ester carboxylesterase
VLLPGWPRAWWQFHKMMPALAERYRVIAVDIRGMGDSDKPVSGYAKKTVASDVYELVRTLGYDKVAVAGQDVGSMVAFSFAANHPEATTRLALWEPGHPNEAWHAPRAARR